MWQGQYEYLGIKIQIKRGDSLFVKNVSIKPSLKKGKFSPTFDHFTMYSYYYGDPETTSYKGEYNQGEYWQDYFADSFNNLPKENRQTNKGNINMTYTAHYNSKKSIDFEEFSAEVEVQLIDKIGNTIIHKSHFDFFGKKKCRLSSH